MSTSSRRIAFTPKTSYEKDALRVVTLLQKAGFGAFFVGGFARDLVLKRKRADIDIASSATPGEAAKILAKFRILEKDKKFGTLRIFVRGGSLELTTFRKESRYDKHRWPKQVDFIQSAEVDANRRDFTINGMMYDPVSGVLYDFVSGKKDLRRKSIRCIGDPKKRFTEDALRMLRAFRFEAQLGFSLERKTLRALEQCAPYLQEVAVERIKSELEKLLMGRYATKALRDMHESHLMKYVLPEIFILSSIDQNPLYHSEGDVFTHTLLTLDELPRHASLDLRLAALFHDAGKAVTTKTIIENGKRKIVSYNHEVVGGNMIRRIMGAHGLRFDNKTINKVEWLVRNHMVMYQLKDMRMAKQLEYATHKWFPELLDLDKADNLGRLSKKHDRLHPFRYGRRILNKAKKMTHGKSLEEHLRKIVTGNDVKEILGISAGPKVGNLLREIRQLFYQGRIVTRKDALRYLKEKKKRYFTSSR